MAYDSIEPFGDDRADLRAGIVAATIANAAPGKRRRAMKPVEFMPFVEKPKPTASQMMQMFRAFTAGIR